MDEKQKAAAKSVKTALKKVAKAELRFLVYDGSVWVVPLDVELWPNGPDGNVMEILYEFGQEVGSTNLYADGGAGV